MLLFAVGGVFATSSIAKYRLANARYTEDLAVSVSAPGFTLGALERDVTNPLEEALSQVNGVESLRSTTTGDSVMIKLSVTAVGVDAPGPTTLVHDAVQRTLSSLPREVEVPMVQHVDPSSVTQHFLVRSETLTRVELSRWLDDQARMQLQLQNGVREVRLCGAARPELRIDLDQARLRALGLTATEVIDALESTRPAGISNSGTTLTVRSERLTMDTLQDLTLKSGAKLRDVARMQLSAEPGRCRSTPDLLMSVRTMPGVLLKLPEHPAAKVTPFVPLRIATYASAPGTPVEQAMSALSKAVPGAIVTSEEGEFTLMLPENRPLPELPGIALRSVDEPHGVVQVMGADFDLLREVSAKARALLEKEPASWVGVPWPQLAPEKVIIATPGVKDIARTVQLAITGVEVGELSDGTGIRLRAGSSLEDAVLPDGRPLSEVVRVKLEEKPAAMLHVNRQRVVEIETGLTVKEAQRRLLELQPPAGVSISCTER